MTQPVIVLFIWICFHVALSVCDSVDEDANLSTLGLLDKYGYPGEDHTVATDDGYQLGLHRIPRPNGRPVLLMHGLMDSSSGWILMGPEKGLGYLLYDRGYDVWLGNSRGNTYSRSHVTYSVEQQEFWDFSIHEMGVFDLPATIDLILNRTNFSQLHYIGHSQGTTLFWILGSERPEYMPKILLMQALAPIAYLDHCKSPPVNLLGAFSLASNALYTLLGPTEFLPGDTFMDTFSDALCETNPLFLKLCKNWLYMFSGFNSAQTNETMVPAILGHTPAGGSTKQIMHYLQIKASGYFRKFDYGILGNPSRYSSIAPPEYRLANVTAKVVLYHAQNDWLAQPKDVTRLYFELPNVVLNYLVDDDKFNHMDFIWGIDSPSLLYENIYNMMEGLEGVAAPKESQPEEQKNLKQSINE